MVRSGWWVVGRRSRLGAALIVCLFVLTVLLLLGMSFLALLGRDYRFAGHQERSEQAWYLALAGLEYYQEHSPPTPPDAATPLRRSVPTGQSSRYFEVVALPDGTLESRGVVTASMAGLAGQVPTVERRIVVPRGAMEQAHDASL